MVAAKGSPRSNRTDLFVLNILLIVGFSLLVINLLTLYLHKPEGYVVDIYSALPLSFFLSLIICFLFGSVAYFLSNGSRKKFGLLLLILNYVVILVIPLMLGYYSMGRADDMSYIGEYAHIDDTGSISPWDIYPASPILGAALIIIPNLRANEVAFAIPIVFSLLFIAGLFLCCRLFLKNERLLRIAVVSSFILYLGPYYFLNVPHALFFAFMPLYLFFVSRFIQKKTIRIAILFLLPTLLVPFMHPFIALFVFSLLLILVLFGWFLDRYIHGDYRIAIQPFLLLITGFLFWFIYNNSLLASFGQSYRSFIMKTTEPVLFGTVGKMSNVNLSIVDLAGFLLVYYGRYIIPIIIIIIAFILLFLKRRELSRSQKNMMIFFSIFYVIFILLEGVLFINPIISHQPDRLTNLNFIVYAQVPLFALALYVLFNRPKDFSRYTMLILVLMTGVWGLSLWGTFSSPHTFKANDALTFNEKDGMAWFYSSRTDETTMAPLTQIGRFQDLFDIAVYEKYIAIPDHFGYNSTIHSFSATNINEGQSSYIILLTIDELLYQKIPGYRELGRYTADDYAIFRNDRTVDGKIYDNLNIEIYSMGAPTAPIS